VHLDLLANKQHYQTLICRLSGPTFQMSSIAKNLFEWASKRAIMSIFKLLLTTRFDQIKIRIWKCSWNRKLYNFELAFQGHRVCLHLMYKSKVIIVLHQLGLCLITNTNLNSHVLNQLLLRLNLILKTYNKHVFILNLIILKT
jgi:hypothetical protein